MISVMFNKYQAIVDVLEEILEQPQNWDNANLTRASNLLQYFNSLIFCFFMCLFNKILNHLSVLYSFLFWSRKGAKRLL